ncbi:MAG: acyl-ACP--UDP-N-acetylglucosamine O-acyltransferase [Proteobacteria bacterium]|nr:acyl-ACP--UDP-N-acetylglucosamine O-acyltransferase [Pseudomonadota bacterium]
MAASARSQAPGIDARALVDPGAALAADVEVGPFAVIGAGVSLGSGCRVGAHAVLEGATSVGPRTRIGAHAVVGGWPQLRGVVRAGGLVIGADNELREHVTVHRGGSAGGLTRLGDSNLLMAYSHLGHDAQLGDGCELANGAQIGGHVVLGDRVTVGGLAAVHQHVRVGALAMVGGGSMVTQDVLPFSLVCGDRARCYGSNAVGLRRHGFSAERRRRIAAALRTLLQFDARADALARLLAAHGDDPDLAVLADFVQRSRRGLCPPARRSRQAPVAPPEVSK